MPRRCPTNLAQERGRLGLIIVIALLLISAALLLWPTLDFEPWVGNILTSRGVLGDIELAGNRPTAQPQILSDILSAVTHIAFGLILIAALDWLSHPAHALRDFRGFFAAPDGQVAMPMIAIFTAAYLFVLIPRISESLIFDRYLIELFPLLAIALLRRFPSPGATAIILLIIYASFALATTQDVLSLARAARPPLSASRPPAFPGPPSSMDSNSITGPNSRPRALSTALTSQTPPTPSANTSA